MHSLSPLDRSLSILKEYSRAITGLNVTTCKELSPSSRTLASTIWRKRLHKKEVLGTRACQPEPLTVELQQRDEEDGHCSECQGSQGGEPLLGSHQNVVIDSQA